jgi:hypothetical protein
VSRRDFAHKVSITEKEASETQYWLEICLETDIGKPEICRNLLAESTELLAIFTAIGRSLHSNARGKVSAPPASEYGAEIPNFDVSDLIPPELATVDD